MQHVSRCVKFSLPESKSVDFLDCIIKEMLTWRQDTPEKPESCGFLLGYENAATHNITLCEITTPQKTDYRSRSFCRLKDKLHFDTVKRSAKRKTYYMGLWHTHPQRIPVPSIIDWQDWNETLSKDITASPYVFFVIIGTAEFRVWAGNRMTHEITELCEAEISNGIYEGRSQS